LKVREIHLLPNRLISHRNKAKLVQGIEKQRREKMCAMFFKLKLWSLFTKACFGIVQSRLYFALVFES